MATDSRPRFILASASPRRRELLRACGIEFTVLPSDIPEIARVGERPSAFVERMAREKAMAVAQSVDGPAWVLGADTVVVVDDRILGKPRDPDEAEAMLRSLSARVHQVMTGVALVGPGHELQSQFHVVTDVEMKLLDAGEIATYVASGEPMDKAGAYAIQGGAAPFIVRSVGSYSNVVGLPVDEVVALLERHGLGGSRA